MRIVLLNDNAEVECVYDNPDAAKYLPEGKTIAVDDDTARKITKSFADNTVSYVDGEFVFTENGNARKREIGDEICSLERWFCEYDRQVAQYQRALRLGETYDERYGTISELDAKAKENAEKLNELRKML